MADGQSSPTSARQVLALLRDHEPPGMPPSAPKGGHIA